MPLRINPKNFGKRDDFTYYGRVIVAEGIDSDAEHKRNIGADPDREIPRFHLKIEGVSIEWVGPDGNVREFWADMLLADGSEYEGRNNKIYHMLASIIAPTDPDECLRHDPPYKNRDGTPAPGLGYSIDAADFPECLVGKTFKVGHRFITFGKNQTTGEEIRTMVPVLIEEMPHGWVWTGERRRITYKGRPGDSAVAAAAATDAGTTTPAEPADFFQAIDGAEFRMAALLKACKATGIPGLNTDPYRSLIASKAGLEALKNCAYITVNAENIIELVDIPESVDALRDLLKNGHTTPATTEEE